ncbi:O-antigen ligase family protein [Calditrichota bacterium]
MSIQYKDIFVTPTQKEGLDGVGIALGLGLLFGIACAWFSSTWTLVAFVVIGIVFFILKRPELLLLVYMILTSSVIEYSQAPSLSIGFGTLYLTDVILLMSLIIIIIQLMKRPDFKIVHTPLDIPILIFWSASIIATIIAISNSSLPWTNSLHEIRTISSYLLFFVVTNLVRDKGQLNLIIKGFFLLATIVALVTIFEHFFGPPSRLIFAGRLEEAAVESGDALSGVTRIILPGQSIIVVALIAGFAILIIERISIIRICQCGLFVLANIITFFRASWLVTGFTFLVIAVLAKKQAMNRIIGTSLLIIVLLIIILMTIAFQPGSKTANLANAAYQRLFTLFETSTFEDANSSLRWRDFEYKYAIPHILANPLVGIGLGSIYRPLTEKDHENFDGRTFIHNGHVWVILKSGILSYLALMWFMFSIFLRGLRHWQDISDPYMRGIVLAFCLTSIGVLIISIVEPYLMTPGWTPVIGIIAGINEVILRRFSQLNI